MYPILLMSHSVVRYALILVIAIVIFKALAGWIMKQTFSKTDQRLSSILMSIAHLQLTLGVILYIISPLVYFGETTMKDSTLRYWSVEHSSLMIFSVALITISTIGLKRTSDPIKKHRRVFIYNSLAVMLVLLALSYSGRGIL
jgi:hypothetical protein